eukprot:TRINITY_DN15016_c0_g1_i1.p1 TRINITY_DN15016_c0_g1~~TRINITY_DN15016_c0_g1_i1.p1  ORF type:complete len:465 (-),score=84.80 TRINITY_DN15016_c0_g1_i1:202-1596(-)
MSDIRQRRVAAESGDIGAEGAEEAREEARKERARKKAQEQQFAPYLIGAVIVMGLVIVISLKVANPHVEFTKKPVGKMQLTRDEVLSHLSNHTLLHIGGVHRSGTTLLADWLTKHNSVTGLHNRPGVDPRKARHLKRLANEGIFMQTVYPRFGLDHDKFLVRKWVGQFLKWIPFLPEDAFPWMKLREGVGRWAMDPRHHLDEGSPLVIPRAQEHLFCEWAQFWDLEKPVLLEKSPSNMMISPFLHRLWSLDIPKSPAKFIFLQRHPIPVALATQRRGGMTVSDLGISDLVENWLHAEERRKLDMQQYFQMDDSRSDDYRMLVMEDILKEPRKILQDLLRWLKIEETEHLLDGFEASVRKSHNHNYFKYYCYRMIHGGEGYVKEHQDMVDKFRDRILAVSPYDLGDIITTCREVLLPDLTPEQEEKAEAKEFAEEDSLAAELDDAAPGDMGKQAETAAEELKEEQ